MLGARQSAWGGAVGARQLPVPFVFPFNSRLPEIQSTSCFASARANVAVIPGYGILITWPERAGGIQFDSANRVSFQADSSAAATGPFQETTRFGADSSEYREEGFGITNWGSMQR